MLWTVCGDVCGGLRWRVAMVMGHDAGSWEAAFHKGDERHNEFSVLVKQDEGYAVRVSGGR